MPDELISGVSRFREGAFQDEKQLFEDLAGGQSPLALFVTCSDSRIDPNLLTSTKPGELFVLRTAGNIIPPYGAVPGGGEAATVEYAVDALGVPDIIVCGHSHCGAMGGLLDPPTDGKLPAVVEMLSHATNVRRVVDAKHPDGDPKSKLKAAVEQNVRAQLDNLKTHPSVAAALAMGKVRLHGWVYTFESGQVHALDEQQDAFVELGPPKDVQVA